MGSYTRTIKAKAPSVQPPGKAGCRKYSAKRCHKCSAKRCITCKMHLEHTVRFCSGRTRATFRIRDVVTCKSANLVYLLDCNRCRDVQYVGETKQTLRKRLYGHRSKINARPSTGNPVSKTAPKEAMETLVARHFQGPGHSIGDLRVTIIELIHHHQGRDSTYYRKKRERFWRHKLKTKYPDGLNVFD